MTGLSQSEPNDNLDRTSACVSQLQAVWQPLRPGVQGLKEVAARYLFEHIWSGRAGGDAASNGKWSLAHSQPLNAELVFSETEGSSFVIPVSGDTFCLHLTRHEFSGIIRIEVDGLYSTEVDLFDIWQDDNGTLLVLSGLCSGVHLARVTITGRNPAARGAECILRSIFLPSASLVAIFGEYRANSQAVLSAPPLHRVLSFNARKDSNVGDLLSCPAIHFPFLSKAKLRDIHDWSPRFQPERAERQSLYDALEDHDVIIGGGGLLETSYFSTAIEFIRFSTRRNLILWGAGHNSPDKSTWTRDFDEYEFSAASFRLIGVRDYNTRFTWVPCASCMIPSLDAHYEIKRPVGFFLHAVVRETIDAIRRSEPNAPIVDNFTTLEEALRFIGESEYVVTNSFHGAYWATLMQRPVLAIPTSSKFFSLRHPLTMTTVDGWRDNLASARTYPEALEECRVANIDFAEKVLEVLS